MTKEKQNWREIDTTTEEGYWQLTRLVAEAVGYRLEPQHVRRQQGEPLSFTYAIIQPDGVKHPLTGFYGSEAVAWKQGVQRKHVPDYLDDLNAADPLLRIIKQSGCAIEITHWSEGGTTLDIYRNSKACFEGQPPLVKVRETDDPCLIRCYAYLAWEDTQHDT